MPDRRFHPGRASSDRSLVMSEPERMPILDQVKPFWAMNETTVCTVETSDRGGRKRGAIAVGLSRHGLSQGFVVYNDIEAAEALVALIRNAIDDAKRIEAGEQPLAPEGITPPVKH